MPKCTCPQPGYCEALGRWMSAARWGECHASPAHCELFHREAAAGKYRAAHYQTAFAGTAAPGRPSRPPAAAARISIASRPASAEGRLACVHRGPVTRSGRCRDCRNSTIPVSVFGCDRHGECTLQRTPLIGEDSLPACRHCPDRLAPSPEETQ